MTRPVFKKRFPWGWLLLGCLAVAVVFGIAAARNAPLKLAVTVPTVYAAGERNPVLTASGYLVARHRATLSAKVPGRIQWLGVEEGSRVTKGQVIARLEAPDLQATRDQVEAQLGQAILDRDRGEALAKDGVLDRASLDKLRTACLTLKAQLAYQDALLENMVLRAPFTGTVTQKLSEVGETVSPGSAGGANAINAVAVLADFDSLELEVEVNETGLPRLRKGMPAEIRVDALDAEPGAKPLRGTLREIYPSSNRQKATVLVRVALVDKHPILVPDMGAKITFMGEPFAAQTIFLGREQIVRRQGKPFVWTLQAGRAALRPVELGEENPVGFMAKGIPADLQLLVVPQEIKLEEGKRVIPRER
ncbi:efflux RND transporter periplasmic adaptor subunit [Mesoterricola silvestris]|uniref:Hemolysin secretion protein D n=1 Tax=Mesoterricola silvestris TaxID=2927979 RepID=A0AA48K9V9_9BACT|nr:efflux RND transporter periplasmic adaptor subunit [Mesoterricola silvestris]BDU74389.1 hemolysin secretion protein D [Mesoterricola silvestris]